VTRVDWQRVVLPYARKIVESYDTGVTLRQLFYRLVSDSKINLPNTGSKYRNLSHASATARRAGTFPDLLDRTSSIERWMTFTGSDDAMERMIRYLYRRDRAERQRWSIYVGVEKAGLSEQLDQWFGDPLGVPILALGGYASQALVGQVRTDIEDQGRRSVLIYAGDFDPTGEDIDRDFVERVGIFDEVIRVGLSEDQVLDLPHNPDPEVIDKLERDPRARRFVERHRAFLDDHFWGEIVQFEIDALPPEELRNLYWSEIERYWDADAHAETMARETADLEELRALRAGGRS
jgi:hypothetical protein